MRTGKKNRQMYDVHHREFMNSRFSRLFFKCLKAAQMQKKKKKKNRQNVEVNVQCAL